jgi:ADP-heptose:LPS heptosyltransferase
MGSVGRSARNSAMRTLVIQFGRLGDVIQTTPLLHDLATCRFGGRTDLLLLDPNQDAILGIQGVATVRTIGERLKPLDDQIAAGFRHGRIPHEAAQLLEQLQLPRYDRVINTSHAALGCWLTAQISAAEREGGVITREGECLYEGLAPIYRVAMLGFREQNWFNIVDLMRCAAHAGHPTTASGSRHAEAGPKPVWATSARDSRLYLKAAAHLPFALPAGPIVALNVGASEKGRRWPAEHFARLAEGLIAHGLVPILVGAPSDLDACDQVQTSRAMALPNFAGKTSIQQMALLLAESALLVSADTGAAHIAAAVDTKVVGLFASSAYFAETSPWGRGHSILQTRIGASMSTLLPDTVLAAVLHRLGRVDTLVLQRELADRQQAAWETDFLPAGSDPLGGLCYRPLHRRPLTIEHLFTRSLRHVLARKFCGGRGNTASDHLADSAAAARGAGLGAEGCEFLRKANFLAHILEQMRGAAAACAEMTARRDAGIGAIATKLTNELEGLKALTEKAPWAMFRPVVHYLDWTLRMMPILPPKDTFLAHADEYRAATTLLRETTALVNGFFVPDYDAAHLREGFTTIEA